MKNEGPYRLITASVIVGPCGHAITRSADELPSSAHAVENLNRAWNLGRESMAAVAKALDADDVGLELRDVIAARCNAAVEADRKARGEPVLYVECANCGTVCGPIGSDSDGTLAFPVDSPTGRFKCRYCNWSLSGVIVAHFRIGYRDDQDKPQDCAKRDPANAGATGEGS